LISLKGKIINHNNSFIGKITFNERINSINKIDNSDFDHYIIPGFVDLHCHGGGGYDTMLGLSDIQKMATYHLKNGTTTILPTTLTATLKDTVNAVSGIKDFIKKNKNSTNILGIHLEGPFINPNKLGAQPNFTQNPNKDFIEKLIKEAPIKLITLAPELEGSEEFIEYSEENKIKVQFGHSLADCKCCVNIMKKYNIGFTHLYNAMSGNDHRNPGVLTAALLHGDYAEIICDLYHVNSENIKLANKCIPGLYAVSDSISASGMPDGEYNFSNLTITKKNNQAWINKNILAGSVINMHDTFKNLLKIDFSIEKAVSMTSYNAAQFISKQDIGKIEKDYLANLVVLDKKYNILDIYLNGKLIK